VKKTFVTKIHEKKSRSKKIREKGFRKKNKKVIRLTIETAAT
jgi:hypothetical protein